LMQATVAALSTEQAANQASQEELNAEYATTVAESTRAAEQLEMQGTEQAELRLAATENALAGNEAEGTVQALEQSEANAIATRDSAVATSEAADNEVLAAQEQAELNTLDPNAMPETIQLDLEGVLEG